MAETDSKDSLVHAPDTQVITLEQAASMMLISNTNPRDTVRRLIRAGKLQSFRNGRTRVTTVGAVRAYIKNVLLRLDPNQ